MWIADTKATERIRGSGVELRSQHRLAHTVVVHGHCQIIGIRFVAMKVIG